MELGAGSYRVSAAFVRIARTVGSDRDGADLLRALIEESVELLDVAAVGVLLADAGGDLQVFASTCEDGRLLIALQQKHKTGPNQTRCRSGSAVSIRDIIGADDQWPGFAKTDFAQEFVSVHACPLRVRNRTIGTMNLFRTEPEGFSQEDVAIGQALADVAAISLYRERIASEHAFVKEELEAALASRSLIEQAKGMIAQSQSIDTNESFRRLSNHARLNNQAIRETAVAVLNRSLVL